MNFKAAVAGASGYAGGEVLRLLAGHPQIEVVTVTAHSQAGKTLGEVHPHLLSLAHLELQDTAVESLSGHDIVVLALPHGHSGQLAVQLEEAGENAVIVDCGADHRLESPQAWEQFYGGDYHPAWMYGVPELPLGEIQLSGGAQEGIAAGEAATVDTPTATNDTIAGSQQNDAQNTVAQIPKQRELLPGAKRIAAPGCNASTVALSLAPAVAAGLVETDDLVSVLAVGPSGAGKSLKPHLLAAERLGSALPYSVGGTHRHIPEIIQSLRKTTGNRQPVESFALSFTPVLVPMARGILATTTATVKPGVSEDDLRSAYAVAYGAEPFVHVLPAGQWPDTSSTLGANTLLLGLTLDEAARRLTVIGSLDNLVKGTAGAVVQSLNLALGLPETTGLTVNGVAP